MIRYVPTTIYHISELLHDLRAADRAEVAAARGRVTAMQLWDDVKGAHRVITAMDSCNRVVAVFGVSRHPAEADVGVVWLLGTDLLDRYIVSLCKEARRFIVDWHKTFCILTNFTDERNTRVLRWLRWLGFIFAPEPILVRGHRFIQFISSR